MGDDIDLGSVTGCFTDIDDILSTALCTTAKIKTNCNLNRCHHPLIISPYFIPN